MLPKGDNNKEVCDYSTIQAMPKFKGQDQRKGAVKSLQPEQRNCPSSPLTMMLRVSGPQGGQKTERHSEMPMTFSGPVMYSSGLQLILHS